MTKNVLHLVRKKSQLRTPFINYQICSNKEFKSLVTFRKSINKVKNGGEFDELDLIKIKQLDLSQDETKWEKLLYETMKCLSQKQIKKISDFVEKERIDICHFHYGTDCGVYYPLLKHLKTPSVVSFYGYDCFSFPKKLWGIGNKYLNDRVFRDITMVFAMSPEMKKDLVKIGCPEEKIIVHYHGIPAKTFLNQQRDYNREKKEFDLLIVSYLDPVKGHLFIFRALQKLVLERHANIRLKIIGQGFYEPVLKNFVKESKLQDHVDFLGFMSGARLQAELENADGFIHPSVITKNDKEGIPGAIVEAMFSGLPVIATYHGGIPYIIENNKSGILVNEWDTDALAAAMVRLSEDPKLREKLGTAAQKKALAELDLSKKEEELERIYDSLIHY